MPHAFIHRFKPVITAIFGVIAVLAMTNFSPSQAETLRVPVSSDIGTLDPDNGFEVAGLSALNNLYEGLVEYEPGSIKIVGLLATNWDVSDDGLIYTFHIRDGVTFHDGTSLDADAVVKSVERRRTGKLVQNYTLANVASVKATNLRTVEFQLKAPQTYFLDTLASPWGPKVISPKAVSQHDADDAATGWLTDHAAGTGPFKLGEFKRGERYTLERNDAYWGEKPYFDKIELPVVPDVGQQILQLKAGEIDAVATNYPFAQLDNIPDSLTITSQPSMTQFAALLKPGSSLDDPAIRTAVLTAINPNLWVSDAFGAYGSVSLSVYPNAMMSPVHPISFPTDMAAAKATISRSPTNLRIGLYSSNPSYGRIADFLIVQLAAIGIKATASIMPPGAAFNMKGSASAPDMLLIIASPDAAHPEHQVQAFYATNAPLNLYGRSLAEADSIVAVASVMTDVKERNKLYEDAGRKYFDAGFAIPLVDVEDVVVHSKGLKSLGLRPVFPRGCIDFATVTR
ncbi:ABC transporter substrate-binding protein [Pararhizobium arenae]|uniref:ABC transporter substrate-binding protein n=1 Tax=Pararhizobium arenae TaxID=1856850 RepID=UPI00094AFEF3|nr:ABC transporter substrate-binding protein [Pararhizobium arenae]